MNTQLSLEVYHDPEIEDEYLTLYVRQADYDEHVLSTIEDIRAGYEGELAGRSGWLLVTTDFRHREMIAIAVKLDDLRQWRNKCDYDDTVSNIPGLLTSGISQAQEVLNRLT